MMMVSGFSTHKQSERSKKPKRWLRHLCPQESLPQPTSACRPAQTARWPHSLFSSASTGADEDAGRRCHKQPSHTSGPRSPSGASRWWSASGQSVQWPARRAVLQNKARSWGMRQASRRQPEGWRVLPSPPTPDPPEPQLERAWAACTPSFTFSWLNQWNVRLLMASQTSFFPSPKGGRAVCRDFVWPPCTLWDISSPRVPSAFMHTCSAVSDCATLWTTVHQAPLSMGFSRQKYWEILGWVASFFSRGSSGPKNQTHVSCTTGGFFTTEP